MRLKPDMESYKCDYCQSSYFPEKNDDGVRVLGEPSGQNCPLCKIPLVHAVLAKNPIIYCTGCKGILILMQMLEGIIEELRDEHGAGAAPVAPDKEDLHCSIACPHCHRSMDAHFYAGPGNVVIDSCEECCLIWLDRGKLMRIVHAPDAPTPSEPSFSADFDSQPAQTLKDLGERAAGDLIVDGIADMFLR
jgi:Zn-finger nucleic acid-binding protein